MVIAVVVGFVLRKRWHRKEVMEECPGRSEQMAYSNNEAPGQRLEHGEALYPLQGNERERVQLDSLVYDNIPEGNQERCYAGFDEKTRHHYEAPYTTVL